VHRGPGGLRDQLALFGEVASDSTAYRVLEAIASDPQLLDGLRAAHAKARSHAWELGAKPERVTIELDATLVGAHSEKEGAAGNYKGGFGFHPLLAYCDESSEALAGILRPGNAGANTPSIRSPSAMRRWRRSRSSSSGRSSCCCAPTPLAPRTSLPIGAATRGLASRLAMT